MKSWWDYQWDYPFLVNFKLSWDNPFCSDGVFHMHCCRRLEMYDAVWYFLSLRGPLQNGSWNTCIALDNSPSLPGIGKAYKMHSGIYIRCFIGRFFSHVGLAKTLDHFVENLYCPKCRPNKFSDDHFVDPGYRRLLCTYKKGSTSTPPEL